MKPKKRIRTSPTVIIIIRETREKRETENQHDMKNNRISQILCFHEYIERSKFSLFHFQFLILPHFGWCLCLRWICKSDEDEAVLQSKEIKFWNVAQIL